MRYSTDLCRLVISKGPTSSDTRRSERENSELPSPLMEFNPWRTSELAPVAKHIPPLILRAARCAPIHNVPIRTINEAYTIALRACSLRVRTTKTQGNRACTVCRVASLDARQQHDIVRGGVTQSHVAPRCARRLRL